MVRGPCGLKTYHSSIPPAYTDEAHKSHKGWKGDVHLCQLPTTTTPYKERKLDLAPILEASVHDGFMSWWSCGAQQKPFASGPESKID